MRNPINKEFVKETNIESFNAYRVDLDIKIVRSPSGKLAIIPDDNLVVIDQFALDRMVRKMKDWTKLVDFYNQSIKDAPPTAGNVLYIAYHKEYSTTDGVKWRMWCGEYNPHGAENWAIDAPVLDIYNCKLDPATVIQIKHDENKRGNLDDFLKRFGDKETFCRLARESGFDVDEIDEHIYLVDPRDPNNRMRFGKF